MPHKRRRPTASTLRGANRSLKAKQQQKKRTLRKLGTRGK